MNKQFIAKTYIEIEQECNNNCAYCVNDISKYPEIKIVPREKILTFINKNSTIQLIGMNPCEWFDEKGDIISLIEDIIKKAENSCVIQVSNFDPGFKNIEKLLKLIIAESCINKNINFPVQSGCNETLKRMNKLHKFTVEKITRLIYPEINYKIHMMVGFPGETDEEFEETLSSMRIWQNINPNIEFTPFKYYEHHLPHSRNYPNKISQEIKEKRANIIYKEFLPKTRNIFYSNIERISKVDRSLEEYDTVAETTLGIDRYVKEILKKDFNFDILKCASIKEEIPETKIEFIDFYNACKKMMAFNKTLFHIYWASQIFDFVKQNQNEIIKNLPEPLESVIYKLFEEDLTSFKLS